MIVCDVHNPTRTPRIIHDGIEGSQRAIRIDPGETVSAALGEGTIALIQGLEDDLVLLLPEVIVPRAAPPVVNGPLPMIDYPLFIEIPAWGRDYVRLATQFTVPAVLASLAGSGYEDVTFFVHTDDRPAFERALAGYRTRFFAMKIPTRATPGQQDPLPKFMWAQFMEAHREAIVATPTGGVVALLNSDIVVSKETFASLRIIFADPSVKVGASVGVRTLIDEPAAPPIGAVFDELARWAWDHRHEITRQSLWGSGRIIHTSHLFFEQDGSVVMHCFHLTPMFIRKDRALAFKGTIDDDLMRKYGDSEIYYMCNKEAFFAELSPGWKKHACGGSLTVDSVVNFGKRKFAKDHVRNFGRAYPVIGSTFQHPAAAQIHARLR